MIFLIVAFLLCIQGNGFASSEVKHRIEDEELIPLGISELHEGWMAEQRRKNIPGEIQPSTLRLLKEYEQDFKAYEFNIDDYLWNGRLLREALKPKLTKKETDSLGFIFNTNDHRRGELIVFCAGRGNCYYGVILIKIFWGPDKGKWLVQDRSKSQAIDASIIGKNLHNSLLIYRNPLLKPFIQYNSDFILAKSDEDSLEAAATMLWKYFLRNKAEQLSLVEWIKPVTKQFHELFGKLYPSVVQWMKDLSKNGNRKALVEWYDQSEDLSASRTVKKILFLLENQDIKKLKKDLAHYEQAKAQLTIRPPLVPVHENKKGVEHISSLIHQLENELIRLKAAKPADLGGAIAKIQEMIDRVSK